MNGVAKKLLVAILILIPILISFGVRHAAVDLPVGNNWGAQAVANYYSGQLRAQIDSQYPNLQESVKQQKVNEELKKLFSNPEVQDQARKATEFFKNAYKYDNDRYYYMPDIDPYEYLAEAKEYLDHGHIGDVKKSDGYWYQMNTMAPNGQRIYVQDLHPLVLAYFYKIGHVFNPDTDVMQTSMYVSAVFAALSTAFVFLIIRRFAGNVGAVFGATLYGILPVIISRTQWGHADTDVWQVLFMPVILFFAMEMLYNEGKIKYVYASLAGLVVGLFSFSWNQWYYIFDIVLGVLGVYLAIDALFKLHSSRPAEITIRSFLWQTYRKDILAILLFIISSGIFVSLLGTGGLSSFIDAPLVIFSNLQLKESAYSTLWPNVYTTVAELAPISFSGAVSLVGKSWMILAALGMVIAAIRRQWAIAITVLFLLIAGFSASVIGGTRFTMFLGLPTAIGVGLLLGNAFKYGTDWAVKLL